MNYSHINTNKAIMNLSNSIKIRTISNNTYNETNFEPFREFITFLENTYQLFHKHTQQLIINEYGLVYKWSCKKSNKKPILLLAHYDVVPVEEGTQKDWKYSPFSGKIEEGYVWGRGTIDIKVQIISILEAVENLIENNFTPERDIYIAFGHDEETGGRYGATKIAQYFKENNIYFDCVLDEGGLINTEGFDGVKSPIAFIGVGEKGFCNLKVSVQGMGGHSSTPPKNTALGDLAKVITTIENHPMQSRIIEPVQEMLYNLSLKLPISKQFLFKNTKLFKPIIKNILSKKPQTNAMIRTTAAITMAKASDAPNVLPQKAETIINYRILPGDTSSTIIKHIKNINKNTKLNIKTLFADEPSKISKSNTKAFKKIKNSIEEIFPDVIITPYLVLGGTDARKYEIVSDNIYRFTPIILSKEEKSKVHNTNERISIDNVEKSISFFINFIESYK